MREAIFISRRAEPIELICEFIRDAEVSSHSMKVKLSPVHRAARPSLVKWRARCIVRQMSSFLLFVPTLVAPALRQTMQVKFDCRVLKRAKRNSRDGGARNTGYRRMRASFGLRARRVLRDIFEIVHFEKVPSTSSYEF